MLINPSNYYRNFDTEKTKLQKILSNMSKTAKELHQDYLDGKRIYEEIMNNKPYTLSEIPPCKTRKY